jgi:hypothetical protein
MRLSVNKPYWVLLSSLFLVLLLSTVVSHTPLTAQTLPSSGTHLIYLPIVQDQTLPPIIQDEVVVKLNLVEPGATIEAINQTYNTITIRPLSLSRAIYLLKAPSDVDIEQLAEAMSAR